MDVFQRYIDHGERALLTHPDYLSGSIDKETAAADTVASILHAVYGRAPLHDIMEDAHGLLERASRSFDGDYEDIGIDDGPALGLQC
jgi:hypothetical protein